MGKELILIIGGARSGKSALAERLARQRGKALFVATAEALDADMERRIQAHRRQRPSVWATLEEPLNLDAAIPPALDGHDTCLLDCLTLWVGNLLISLEDNPNVEAEILAAVERLIGVYERSSASWIVVSNEVGQGVAPASPLGRAYRDILGRANRNVASHADRVYLTVAGYALDVKALGVPISEVRMGAKLEE